MFRLGNCGVRVSVFGFKNWFFLAVYGQIWQKLLGTYDPRSSEKYTKFLLIWSTESWETQLLKGTVTNPHAVIPRPEHVTIILPSYYLRTFGPSDIIFLNYSGIWFLFFLDFFCYHDYQLIWTAPARRIGRGRVSLLTGFCNDIPSNHVHLTVKRVKTEEIEVNVLKPLSFLE